MVTAAATQNSATATGAKTSGSAGASSSQGTLAKNFDNFLTLLTTQLKNQDPLSPMDTDRFTQQIVEFTSLEQSMKINKSLEQLVELTTTGSRDSMASWLGSVVEARSDAVEVGETGAVAIPVRLESDAAKVTVKVLGGNDAVLFSSTFAASAGMRSVQWNGRGPDGARVAPGSYRVTVEAADSRDRKVEATTTIRGTVDAVDLKADPPVLRIGDLSIPLDKVTGVFRAPAPSVATTNSTATNETTGRNLTMTLFGSLFTGVSGLTAQSRSMGVISDNVANVNTIGYKGAYAEFSSLVTSNDMRLAHSPGGVIGRTQFMIPKQGILQGTSSATDAAITGNGFFVVNPQPDSSGQQLYTRAGSFQPDALGNLRTSTGFYLQGWPLDQQERIIDQTRVETVNTRSVTAQTTPTTKATVSANLDAGQAPFTGVYASGDMALYAATDGASGVQPDFKRNVEVYDSLGNTRQLTLAFKRSAAPAVAQWDVEIYCDPALVEGGDHTNGRIADGIVSFNGNGTLQDVQITPIYPGTAGANDPVGINWLDTTGADDSSITFDWGEIGSSSGLTQYSGTTTFGLFTKDGSGYGQLSNIKIDDEGYVVATFSNGSNRRIYMLPLATFANPAALDPLTGNVFSSNRTSMDANLLIPGTGGAGSITPANLETANVDLADEFSKMIVTQRAYSANARVITTTDDMLDELIRLRR